MTLRLVESRSRSHAVVRGVAQPLELSRDLGAHVTASIHGASAYAATPDLSAAGLRAAAELAADRARRLQGVCLDPDSRRAGPQRAIGRRDAVMMPAAARPFPAPGVLVDRLRALDRALAFDPRIVDRRAAVRESTQVTRLLVDGELVFTQRQSFVEPMLEATASDGRRAQARTLGGRGNGLCREGGFEVFEAATDDEQARRIADEAIELLLADECPGEVCDLLLAPDQMMLQIHESIGHPLELDRILGDERNFAGTSFVTLAMFGRYRYGSELLNVSHAPDVAGEFASCAFDDDGTPASRVVLIRDGMLLRPLGGAGSAARAAREGYLFDAVSCARASGWHRTAIDRMVNLNIEPGDSTFEQMVASVERGVYMQTNASWSIDDARDKFQFGCERGRLIRDGRLGAVVRNPGYRGRSAEFWRGLARVGDRATLQLHGTPSCGKGEPGQVVRVGHASPACLFRGVEVFGGG